MTNPTPANTPVPPATTINEVRYSLPQLLKELEIERAAGIYAMEKLDQVEITKLFKAQTAARRAKSKK
ncbi:MAG: hypothetical protein ABIZ04_04560 [Opitutus sp.]